MKGHTSLALLAPLASAKSQNIPEIFLTYYFESLTEVAQLEEAIHNPISKYWKTLALVELFRRDTEDARYVQSRYMEYVFRHHTTVSRRHFIYVLNRAGVLSNWDKLPSNMSSLLYGAIFDRYPIRKAALDARIFSAEREDSFEFSLVPAVISLYCLAESDAVREHLFKSIIKQIGRRDDESLCELPKGDLLREAAFKLIIYLAPYLTREHLEIARKTVHNQKKVAANYRCFDDKIFNLSALANITVSTSQAAWKKWIANSFDTIMKINSGINRVILANGMRQARREFITQFPEVGSFDDPNKIEEMLARADLYKINQYLVEKNRFWDVLNRYYWRKGDESWVENGALFRKSITPELKLKALLMLIDESYDDSAFGLISDIVEEIIPYFAKINLRAVLTKNAFQALVQCYSHTGDTGQGRYRARQLLLLTIHRQLPDINEDAIFKCLFHFPVMSFYGYRRCPVNFAEDYYSLFLRLPLGNSTDLRNGNDSTRTRFGLLYCIFIIFTHQMSNQIRRDVYLDMDLQGFARFSKDEKQCVCMKLMEEIKNGNYNAFYLLARFAKGLRKPQVDELFTTLSEQWLCSTSELHTKTIELHLVEILHLLYEMDDAITHINGIAVDAIINHYLSASLEKNNITLFRFIVAYRPHLTSSQITLILNFLINERTTNPSSLEQHNWRDLTAAIGKYCKVSHIPLLERLAHVETQPSKACFMHRLFTQAAEIEHKTKKSFKLGGKLRDAIASTDGYACRVTGGYFRGQPSRPFREMLEIVGAMENGEKETPDGFKQLKEQANKLNVHSLVEAIKGIELENENALGSWGMSQL